MYLYILFVLPFFCMVHSEYNIISNECSFSCINSNKCNKLPSKCGEVPNYPNYMERYVHVRLNIARFYPVAYSESKFGPMIHKKGLSQGKKLYVDGDSIRGGCGRPVPYPMYLQSEGSLAVRWWQKDKETCTTPRKPHDTCHTTLTGPPGKPTDYLNCCFGGKYGFVGRWWAFSGEERGKKWSAAEAAGCPNNHNDCWDHKGHCGSAFERRRWVGIGSAPGSSHHSIMGIRNGKEFFYPVVGGSHFDNTKMLPSSKGNPQKPLTFIAYYWNTEDAKGFLAYKGRLHRMTRTFGHDASGSWEVSFAVPASCEPYYFVFKTARNTYRLPENKNYYFGTDGFPSKCTHNHYWRKSNNQILANSGPDDTTGQGKSCDKNCSSKVNAISNLVVPGVNLQSKPKRCTWYKWSDCNKPCGGGERKRLKKTEAFNGGYCETPMGVEEQKQKCNTQKCATLGTVVKYVGCFQENKWNRDFKEKLTRDHRFTYMSVAKCADLCKDYPYFGINWGSICTCSYTEPDHKQVDDGECTKSKQCPKPDVPAGASIPKPAPCGGVHNAVYKWSSGGVSNAEDSDFVEETPIDVDPDFTEDDKDYDPDFTEDEVFTEDDVFAEDDKDYDPDFTEDEVFTEDDIDYDDNTDDDTRDTPIVDPDFTDGIDYTIDDDTRGIAIAALATAAFAVVLLLILVILNLSNKPHQPAEHF